MRGKDFLERVDNSPALDRTEFDIFISNFLVAIVGIQTKNVPLDFWHSWGIYMTLFKSDTNLCIKKLTILF